MEDEIKNALTRARAAIEQGDAARALLALDDVERLAAVVPEIGIYMDGGLIQEVYRANDAPFALRIHDHDVEGTSADVCELTWPDGSTEDAVISTHDHRDDNLRTSEAYWNSLRDPVVTDPADDGKEDQGERD